MNHENINSTTKQTNQNKFYASDEKWSLQCQEPLNPDHQLGSILLDNYRLDSILGEGSFAVVFSASTLPSSNTNSLTFSSKVAVKCLYKTGLSKSQLLLQREEISLLERVASHPNITTLLGTCETQHHLYMVIEYCELDLFDGILKSPLSTTKALELFEELVDAVASCHKVGVYHRDLKPENILLTCKNDPHVRLTDFGLATTDELSTEFGCGSLRYMSPECLSSSTTLSKNSGSSNEKLKRKGIPYLSSANDVWSLAIILINMLTGKNPWVEPNGKDKHFRSHLINKQNGIDSFQSQFNFSNGFCQVLRLVFSSSPQNRPSAREFLAHVQRLPSLFASSKPRSHSTNKQKITVSSKNRTITQTCSITKPTITFGLVSPSSFSDPTNVSSIIRASCQAPINVVNKPKILDHALPLTPEFDSISIQDTLCTTLCSDKNKVDDDVRSSSPSVLVLANSYTFKGNEDLLFVMDEDHVLD